MNRILLSFSLLLLSLSAWGQSHLWLHVQSDSLSYRSYKKDRIAKIQHLLSNDISEEKADSLIITMNDSSQFKHPLSLSANVEVGTNIPTIYIQLVDNPNWTELRSKEEYQNALIWLDGNGQIPDVDTCEVQVKGRGNSTWMMPKKPYRLKFNKKTAFGGLAKAKSFALIANYIDPTQLRNAMALKTAQLFEMPF